MRQAAGAWEEDYARKLEEEGSRHSLWAYNKVPRRNQNVSQGRLVATAQRLNASTAQRLGPMGPPDPEAIWALFAPGPPDPEAIWAHRPAKKMNVYFFFYV